MATVVSIVNTFLLNGRVVGETAENYAHVPAVYRPHSSITGATVVTGDGHVTGGIAGTLFGTPSFYITTAQTAQVGGIASAQSFGTPIVKTAIGKPVGGIGSAQAFGAVGFSTRITVLLAGLASPQQFGTVAPRGAITRTVGSVASSQVFGAVTTSTRITVTVTGVASAQSFGTVRANVRLATGGVSTAQQFGVPRANYRQTLTGVASAQAFGVPAVRLTTAVTVPGVASAQSFGAIRTRVTISVGSVASAQQFGTPTTAYRIHIGGVASAQQFGSLVGRVWLTYLHPETCLDEELDPLLCLDVAEAPICGEHITGEIDAGRVIVVGGTVVFLDDFACLPSPSAAVLNQFLCGDGTTVGGAPWNPVVPPPVEITLAPAPVIDLVLTESR